MWIGNDIVDLKDPMVKGKSKEKRFVRRICSEEERAVVAEASDPDKALWVFWAIKEATYKALKKKEANTSFVPPEFVCCYVKGEWRCRGAYVQVVCNKDFVHAIAFIGDRVSSEIIHAIKEERNDQSAAVRQLSLKMLVQKGFMNCSIARGEKEGKLLPPQIIQNGIPVIGCDLSLSHDGRYVAATLAFCSIRASASPTV